MYHVDVLDDISVGIVGIVKISLSIQMLINITIW